MEIVKAFSENTLHTEITIKGTHKEPLFRASDIGLILELSNIRQSIKDFDETQKVVILNDTHGGTQQVTFLTEEGLYEVLSMSRKPIAKIFKKWVFQVVKEIRLTGEYKLNKTIQDLNDTILQKDAKFSIDLTRTKEKTLIESNKKKSVVYCGQINEDYKFGYSDDIERRVRDHKTDFGAEFTLLFVFESPFYMKIEKMIKKELKDKIYSKEFNAQLKIELIKINETYTENMFYSQIQEYHKYFLSLITIESLSQENNKLVEDNTVFLKENNKLVEDNTVFLKENNKLVEENNELKNIIIELSKKIITPSSVQPSQDQDIINKLLERRANKAAYQREYCIKNKDKIKEYEIANADRTKATKALYRAKKNQISKDSSTSA